jgi:flagellar biosynthetic protein FlhB
MVLKFDLQLFGEKTEKATPKKKRDARNKGQVVQSKEIASSLIIIVVFFSLNFLWGFYYDNVSELFRSVLEITNSSNFAFDTVLVLNMGRDITFLMIKLMLPTMLVAMVTGVIFSYVQVGFLFTVEPLKVKLSKINPISGFKKLFSMKSIVELVKSVSKAAALLYISINYIMDNMDLIIKVLDFPVAVIAANLWKIVYNITMRVAIFLFIVSILDYIYKKWENEKELKMSKQEIKDEYKNIEGDPLIKSKIKEKQRSIAMSRMMQEVPEADVIITNPTHFAVVIKYKEGYESPMVVAKGQDLIALNIKRIGKENEVPIVENKPLARALFKDVEIGEYIPEQYYKAVAEVLAFVYNKNR